MTTSEKTELTPIESVTLDLLTEICEKKASSGIEPAMASPDEISNSFNAEKMDVLRGLYRKGLIEYHSTVNGVPLFNPATDNENIAE